MYYDIFRRSDGVKWSTIEGNDPEDAIGNFLASGGIFEEDENSSLWNAVPSNDPDYASEYTYAGREEGQTEREEEIGLGADDSLD